MANGVGSFLTGLTEGFAGGRKLAMAMDQNEREKAKADRDEKAFVTSQAAAKQQQELAGLQIADQKRRDEEAVRKANMQAQIKDDMTAYQAWISGRSDQPPPSVALVLEPKTKPRGVGNVAPVPIDVASLTESQRALLEASIFQKARIDHKFMDEEAFEKQRQLTKTLTKEGVIEAFDIFDKTGNSDKATKAFNGTGAIKGFEGMQLRREVNPMTGRPDIMVYGLAADGKTLEPKTSRFEMMMAMMPDKMIDFGIKSMQEDNANKRTASTNATSTYNTQLNNAGAMDRAKLEQQTAALKAKDPVFEQLDTLIMGQGKSALSNPQLAMDIEKSKQDNLETMNVAYSLYYEAQKIGKPISVAEAAAVASERVQAARARAKTK